MESPFVLDGASNGVPPPTCPQSNAVALHPYNADDFFFGIPKIFLRFGQHCYWPAPPPNLPSMPLLIFGCRRALRSAGVVREDGNEEGRLTGRTRFRSGGIGWRICPIGRLRQRRERWSILLQNSHGGLLNPRRKAAFPSETERERKGEEKRESRRRRDGMMEGWRFRKKKIANGMRKREVPMARRSIGKYRTGRSKQMEVTGSEWEEEREIWGLEER